MEVVRSITVIGREMERKMIVRESEGRSKREKERELTLRISLAWLNSYLSPKMHSV